MQNNDGGAFLRNRGNSDQGFYIQSSCPSSFKVQKNSYKLARTGEHYAKEALKKSTRD